MFLRLDLGVRYGSVTVHEMSQQDGRRKLIRVKPHGNGFGFTLRFCADDTVRNAFFSWVVCHLQFVFLFQPGGQPSESIVFIKSVVSKGPASVAGLSPGDWLLQQ